MSKLGDDKSNMEIAVAGSTGDGKLLQQKVYIRRIRGRVTKVESLSRRNLTSKVVREHYLRGDISCGSKLCLRCRLEIANNDTLTGMRELC